MVLLSWAAFKVEKYYWGFIFMAGAMFHVFAGNIVIYIFGDYANHWLRWSPFYVLTACAGLSVLLRGWRGGRSKTLNGGSKNANT